MQEKKSFFNSDTVKKLNIACLLLVICCVLFYPAKKNIWYDETVSVLCAKGLYYTDGNALTALPLNTSVALEQQNTLSEAYTCTIIDNGNSLLYNEGLHFFTMLSGNSFSSYLLYSKLCAIATLLAFFALCSLFMEGSIFTSLALLLLTSDTIFWGMAQEVRAYEMGMLMVTLATTFFYKYMYKGDRPYHLFLTGMFAVAAILSHYLSVYIILVLLAFILFVKRTSLFSAKNILAIAIPVTIVGIYFYSAAKGFGTMQNQNNALKAKQSEELFSVTQVVLRSLKFGALNFKTVFPAFNGSAGIVIVSFLMVIALYFGALKFSKTPKEKRNLHLLFILGVSSSIFLAALSIKSHHYTALYSRYYTFCVPFATLFVAYALKVLYDGVNKNLATGLVAIIVIPCLALLAMGAIKRKTHVKYNHLEVAGKISNEKINKITVPDWTDAFLLQSFLPSGYKIEYKIDSASTNFVLFHENKTDTIKVIRINS